MPKKPVARMGDTGSHGGMILSGSPTTQANGRPIAHVQDIYGCPVHGPNPIITGAPNIFGGAREIAYVGSKTACGAIITQGSPDVFIDTPESPISINNDETKSPFDEQVRVVDNTGKPMASVPYFIQDEEGNIYKGITDSDGCCERIFTNKAQKLKIYLGVQALEKGSENE